MRSVFGFVVGLPVALAVHSALDVQNDALGVLLGFGCVVIAWCLSYAIWDD